MKHDVNGDELVFEKVLELNQYGESLGIWKVDIERCREQDKNARVMDKAVFEQLKSNIADSKSLESLPYGYIKSNSSGNLEFHIISGHHRVRAARSANIKIIYVLATQDDLSNDEIVAKQLAHNALSGSDDKQVLQELFDAITSVDEKTRSGIRSTDFDKQKFRGISADDVKVDYEFKLLKVIFLSSQMINFEDVVKEITSHEEVCIAGIQEFENVAQTLRSVSKKENIRNIASILNKMCDIVKDYYKAKGVKDDKEVVVNTLSGVMSILREKFGYDTEKITNTKVLKKYVGKTIGEIENTIKMDITNLSK